jgi:hypothetical protein
MFNSKDEVRLGALYAFEYNMNIDQWHIYLAENNLPWKNYKQIFGIANRIYDEKKEILDEIKNLNILLWPEKSCWLDHIPSDHTYKAVTQNYKKLFLTKCSKVIDMYELQSCKVEVRECL